MIEKKVPLKDYCSYKTGGKAEFFTCPTDTFDLKVVLKFASDNSIPVTLIGTGYNILVSDKGVKGLVVSTGCMNNDIQIEGELVFAGAGVSLNDLILKCIDNGLAGLENMSGIPGSVGGAVIMNAGAFGTEIKDVAVQIEMCGFDGVVSSIHAEDAGFGYRKAENLKGIVTGLGLKLEHGNKDELLAKRAEILKKRSEKQPLEFPSCGSVFKRPEGGYAGTLIEQCGLKGYKIGGAQVSEKHANFIVNTGKAKSADIYALINHVQETVFKETGIKLEREVRFVGF
ncbi:UDP-N-acetylenolpyruvoylglucosamine reductase [Denitrovibrio acetiphilus DSM 12809]|uniref:UDP-N-acetylenolpyruvoylglucosamine reductase n=1 Tax=Denitrovibrio acetiphilus (strain DSM 12809 / NBRC 114555 / N2460) TaxID=522772 RepID=D4H3W5_DENA2|nr:UDP-N-acetylmuramate dehydrogenase [Denitrovibrio acetiphilus]ADD67276.1 UDP-N-acetylenolpyruvoylglucosamine reductase [Denitrovibrio acetiphilus DSM 12809]